METLPLFPLGIIAFPGEKLNLHIFEDRYKQLITECDMYQKPFGVSPVIKNSLMEVGTEMELVAIERIYPDGKMDIKTKGKRVYRLRDFRDLAPGKLYPEAEVVYITPDGEYDTELQQKIFDSIQKLFAIMKVKKEIGMAQNLMCFDVAHHVGFNQDQKIAFLKITKEMERQQYMLTHLNKMIPMAQEMENLKQRVQLNGHFKHLIPPKI